MSKSQRLSIHDVNALLELQGEAWSLHARGRSWHERCIARLTSLVGAQYGMMTLVANWHHPGHKDPMIPTCVVAGHLDADQQAALRHVIATREWREDGMLDLLSACDEPISSRRRRDLLEDGVWYRLDALDRNRFGVGLDDALLSGHALDGGGMGHLIALHRSKGDRSFTERERLIVQLLHHHLGPLLAADRAMAWSCDDGLSPRLRQTLACLLHGQSMKQVARSLNVSYHTVHSYVKALHEHFGVNSRGELLAKCFGGERAPGSSLPQ